MIRIIRKDLRSTLRNGKNILHLNIVSKKHSWRKILHRGAKKILGASVVAALFVFPVANALAAPSGELPKDTFEWVQSTSMSAYYFNKEQICYGKGADGYIDRNILIVPTVKIYGDKQIEDVVQKRRWRMESTDGYGDLIGAADYLEFDVAANTVTITEHDDLDKNWWPLTKNTDAKTIKINELSEKAVDGIFYRAILAWAKNNDKIVLDHSIRKGLSLKK